MTAKQWAGTLVFLLLTALLGWGIGALGSVNNVYPETTAVRQADGCDVIFVGTSQCDLGVDPVALYAHNGIAAYNYAASGQYIGLTVLALEEILQRQSPQVAVIDYQCLRPSAAMTLQAEYNVWFSLQQLAWPGHRLAAYQQWMKQDLLYLLPLFRYHNLWEPSDAPKVEYAYRMGWRISDAVTPFDALPAPADEPPAELAPTELAYLDGLLAQCAAKGVRVVLLNIPEYAEGNGIEKAVAAYAAEHGALFWDGTAAAADIGLDPATDFYEAFHLNRSGAQKFSVWLADRLDEAFSLPDRRGDPAYAAWARYVPD